MPVSPVFSPLFVSNHSSRSIFLALCLSTAATGLAGPASATGQVPATDSSFVQAVAETAAADEAVAAFYRETGYAAIWTDADDAARRNALLLTLSRAGDHALPVSRYDAGALLAALRSAQSERDRGRVEVQMTEAFLDYARDVQTGVLEPKKVDAGIVREVPVRDRRAQLDAFLAADPAAYLRGLPPVAPEYAQLMRVRFDLLQQIAAGGWGPEVDANRLEPGDSGATVVALRDRLVAMGYLRPTASAEYDAAMRKAVETFQISHGLTVDGVAGASTLDEINVGAEDRLKSVVVAMERMRWMAPDLGTRHVWVNLPDFTARIVDHGRDTFVTRAVVGKASGDLKTPEFSDQMEMMVLNPSWSVPRSITTKEYLPLLKANPNAAGHLKIVDRAGREVSRASIDFSRYTAANFPYAMRQPPSDGNALGKVKFLFPNPYNIYLHDTPQKQLFSQEVRAYSHGCIRLADPIDFAYAMLAPQSADPEAEFDGQLKTKAESVIKLTTPVPVHLVYFTAFPDAKGEMTYRRDIYGRDAEIFRALTDAGVALDDVQG